jgi:hypothetical protein
MKVLVLLFLYVLVCYSQVYTIVLDDSNTWHLKPGKGGLADAVYLQQMNSTGWDILQITTDSKQTDNLQAWGAGFIEGALTHESIWNAWSTNAPFVFPDGLSEFVLAQDKWVRSQDPVSDYWIQVNLVLKQFDGLIAGYTQYAPIEHSLSYLQMLYLQLGPELDDLTEYLQIINGSGDGELLKPPSIGSHCSVLVKLSSDGQHLYSSHDTWSHFNTMLRIYKHYNLQFSSVPTAAVSFSSYPANLQSVDDFYITSTRLVIMETTNEVMNDSLYRNFIKKETVPEWIRIIVANRVAVSGEQWANLFEMYNSGTYNNQWQVIDYKLFVPGSPLKPGTLWIAEQIPGLVVSKDMTSVLSKQNFWPSYNIPYFDQIYNLSNYPAYYNKYGNTYSYSECARAQIFHRDAGKVETIENMKRIMRYNKYQTDPLSLHDACRSISARCDLNAPWTANTLNEYSPFGAIDSKITDEQMVLNMEALAVSGPTWDSQPPFAWTKQWKSVLHYGQPTLFAFDYVSMSPNVTV